MAYFNFSGDGDIETAVENEGEIARTVMKSGLKIGTFDA